MLGPVRARDLRANIKAHGFERGVVITLEQMLDEFAIVRHNIRDMVSMLDKCVDEVSKMVEIGGKLRNELVDLQRLNEQGDDIDGTPHE